MRNKMIIAAALGMLAAGLSGCAGFGGFTTPSMGQMSEQQIKAIASDKSSSAGCTKYTGTGGQFVAAFTNTDKGTVNTGGGDVEINCGDIVFKFRDNGRQVPPVPIPIQGLPAGTK